MVKKKILICPLDWGLGHGARCVSIIHDLNSDFDVLLAGSGRVKPFLRQEFPTLPFIDFEGYNINYPSGGSMAIKMMAQLPKVIQRIRSEKKELAKIIENHGIDLVISDNRFGLSSDSIPSVYITHQINVQAPGLLANLLYKLHAKYINRYTECWIPDFAESMNLSGALSHGRKPSICRYTGPISRLSKVRTAYKYDYCALLSGPEPQRTKFENLILETFKGQSATLLLLQGAPEEHKHMKIDNVEIVSHMNDQDLAKNLCASKTVICRSGYSSIMDLAKLGVNCIFVPTPGQTEQYYLAKHHLFEHQVPYIDQHKLGSKLLFKTKGNPIKLDWKEPSFSAMITEILIKR
ncbi:MAG: glycosyltransferase [Flavobacteriales bacterium]|nr:glycosyltransferase [Flavobacteriales bacterium]